MRRKKDSVYLPKFTSRWNLLVRTNPEPATLISEHGTEWHRRAGQISPWTDESQRRLHWHRSVANLQARLCISMRSDQHRRVTKSVSRHFARGYCTDECDTEIRAAGRICSEEKSRSDAAGEYVHMLPSRLLPNEAQFGSFRTWILADSVPSSYGRCSYGWLRPYAPRERSVFGSESRHSSP